MHEGANEVTLELARRLIDEQFPSWRGERLERVTGSGTVNTIFRIGTGWTARFPLVPEDTDESREASAVARFAAACPFDAPLYVASGRPGPGYPGYWAVQTWVPGAVATPWIAARSEAVADDVSLLITALRNTPTEGRSFRGSGRGGELSSSDAWMERCFRESTELLDVPPLRRWWARLRMLPRTQPDVMCHGDLTPANLLICRDRLSGVIDTGGFAPADPALDLIVAWHLFDTDARERVRAGVGAEPDEWRRGAAWAFEQAMGLVWYYRVSNPQMAELGRNTLERITSDSDLAAWARC